MSVASIFNNYSIGQSHFFISLKLIWFYICWVDFHLENNDDTVYACVCPAIQAPLGEMITARQPNIRRVYILLGWLQSSEPQPQKMKNECEWASGVHFRNIFFAKILMIFHIRLKVEWQEIKIAIYPCKSISGVSLVRNVLSDKRVNIMVCICVGPSSASISASW